MLRKLSGLAGCQALCGKVRSRMPGIKDAEIQSIEEQFQPALTRLMSGHLLQNLAYFNGGVRNRPADLTISDIWIASVVELKRSAAFAAGPIMFLV